ncbi:hypothetical protein NEF87_003291 [Candidatus Lokiarchaeum ossiferum]|uniref:non-specific serine/threonine protein kinase n=1 Tax=Candidatus Lokiarchaeum ossiferum TaxID=2951803 RepID=A0ABY6HU09_9ARCH|nr:hypothetical protein NEF87_003291 [Candidatus Lokiarchaeum sp. B-35]
MLGERLIQNNPIFVSLNLFLPIKLIYLIKNSPSLTNGDKDLRLYCVRIIFFLKTTKIIQSEISIMDNSHNQKIGFDFSKDGINFDSIAQNRLFKSKFQLKEITVAQAKEQLLATQKIDKVLKVIGGGKEATVLLAQEKDTGDLVCAKVFRYYTSTIRKRLQGTRHISENGMAGIAASQEYWNLDGLYKAGIPVPKPRLLLNNIAIMDFISSEEDETVPAPLLRDVDIRNYGNPEEIFYESIGLLADMFLKAHYIHGDYSDHNLLIKKEGLITMDVSQSVEYNQKTFINTPVRIRIDHAVDMLRVDIENINQAFRKNYRLHMNTEEVLKEILDELPQNLQSYLGRTEDIPFYSEGFYAPEIYAGKEQVRQTGVRKRSKRNYQRKKR